MTQSKRWLQAHQKDVYVKEAKRLGYRSRAAFKLLEIDRRFGLLKPGTTVIDLGAAPGSWSAVVAQKVGSTGQVVAIDLLPMASIPGVTVIQGDFNDESVSKRLFELIQIGAVDLVISDMAPNLSGNKLIDQARAMHLAELALDCAQRCLRIGGIFLTKVFQGEGIDQYRSALRHSFAKVSVYKPKASRSRSSEVYMLGTEFLGYNE